MPGHEPPATPPEQEEDSRTSYWDLTFDLLFNVCEAVLYGVFWLMGAVVRGVIWLLAAVIGEA